MKSVDITVNDERLMSLDITYEAFEPKQKIVEELIREKYFWDSDREKLKIEINSMFIKEIRAEKIRKILGQIKNYI